MTANVLGLCEEAELEAQMFVLAQMFIRIPNVQISTEPAFSQNPCCAIVLYQTSIISCIILLLISSLPQFIFRELILVADFVISKLFSVL